MFCLLDCGNPCNAKFYLNWFLKNIWSSACVIASWSVNFCFDLSVSRLILQFRVFKFYFIKFWIKIFVLHFSLAICGSCLMTSLPSLPSIALHCHHCPALPSMFVNALQSSRQNNELCELVLVDLTWQGELIWNGQKFFSIAKETQEWPKSFKFHKIFKWPHKCGDHNNITLSTFSSRVNMVIYKIKSVSLILIRQTLFVLSLWIYFTPST